MFILVVRGVDFEKRLYWFCGMCWGFLIVSGRVLESLTYSFFNGLKLYVYFVSFCDCWSFDFNMVCVK